MSLWEMTDKTVLSLMTLFCVLSLSHIPLPRRHSPLPTPFHTFHVFLMSESEEKPPLDTVDDAHPSPTERTPPTYPAQRIARCIMRFLLMVLYLLFLCMEPSNDFSVSTIAGSDEGMHFGAIRESVLYYPVRYADLIESSAPGSCAGSVCTELLQRQGMSLLVDWSLRALTIAMCALWNQINTQLAHSRKLSSQSELSSYPALSATF